MAEIIFPVGVLALTSGPNQPEFSTFTPVSTTEMVNLFTGDFNYNIPVIEIPGVDGGGYALSLSYNSGVTSEQEASWVGLGWSLNPGVINRSVRGFPDDYNGAEVKYYNKTRPNWTVNVGASAGVEAFSVDVPIGASISNSLRFNNYYGYQRNLGLGISAKGIGLNFNIDNDGFTFRPSINPIAFLNSLKDIGKEKIKNDPTIEKDLKTYHERRTGGKGKVFRNENSSSGKSSFGLGIKTSSYASILPAESSPPPSFNEYTGRSFNWSASIQFNPFLPVGFETGFQGGVSFQYNDYLTPRSAYGFLNSSAATSSGVMDYYVEKGSTFNKRDVFIGMPFSNADQFIATGEGIQGGFRAYHHTIGTFKPNDMESNIGIFQLGSELALGGNIGVGVDIGAGSQKTEMSSWGGTQPFSSSDETHFRFTTDQGGKIAYTSKDDIETAITQLNSFIPGFRSAVAIEPQAEGDGRTDYSLIKSETGQSSFIKESNTSGKLDGFEITNEGGVTYAYSEPLRVRNETNLSVDIERGTQVYNRYLTFDELQLGKDGSDYEVKSLNQDVHKSVLGEIRNESYVNNFLLTAITSPNYVDVDDNGPSVGDFGGWTSFQYRSLYGEGQSKWYRYRTPYAGLLYNQNAISDTKDDLGSIVTGEKEIKYLKSIDTKTHRAYFITNKTDLVNTLEGDGDITSEQATELRGLNLYFLKGNEVDNPALNRKDGLGAPDITNQSDPASSNGDRKGDTNLEYLDKIVLFPKDPSGNPVWEKPLKVVRFDYDYSLVPNVPNNVDSNFDFTSASNVTGVDDIGKLTLKKVWFEYNGTHPARISPYKFEYNYPQASDFLAGQEIFKDFEKLPESIQNPIYSPYLLGPWGNPMGNAEDRKERGIPWVDQSARWQTDYYEKLFDPAAWHLKQIVLPSGGKINVQYEEKDYTKVQDRDAMAMASLVDIGDEQGYNSDPIYSINVEDMGINPEDGAMVNKLRDKIEDHFTRTGDKIYFKFLYALKGRNPSLDDCRSEYISGYANFESATVNNRNGKNVIDITLANVGGSSGSRGSIPRQACFELVSNQKQGKLDNSSCIESDYERKYENAIIGRANNGDNGIGPLSIQMMLQMSTDGKLFFYQLDDKDDVCLTIDHASSFLKLPMTVAKKATGARVKRLLFYDQGLESGDPSLYGTEYIYVKEDGITSSGVATNEPSAAREENPLVNFIARGDQGFFSRITAGEDKKQSEGPLGESILPAPSIGHSRVVVKNINSGPSGDGFTVHEFHTANEFPYDGVYSAIDTNDKRGVSRSTLDTQRDFLTIPAGVFNYTTTKAFTSQGFRFLMNNMHGQTKSVSNYAGQFSLDESSGQYFEEKAYVVSQQQYEYFKPGESVRMFRWDKATNSIEEYEDLPGKEMEMAFESRKIKDKAIDFSVELDISVTVSLFPPIFVTLWPSFSMQENILATHATTKIIQYPVIPKSVTTYQDGIYHTQENVAFNSQNGKPILVRNTDGYHNLQLAGNSEKHDGSIYQLTIPAAWMEEYEAMGPKSTARIENLDVDEFKNLLNSNTATFTIYGKEPETGWSNWFDNPVNLLSASVQTFSNDWFNSTWTEEWPNNRVIEQYELSSSDLTELNQIWRPKRSYVYKADNLYTSSASEKVYSSGTFNVSSQFDWNRDFNNQDQQDNNWIRSSEVVLYNPNGEPIEEKDVLDIHSAAIFKPSAIQHLPSMVVANGEYNTIFFEDYEYATETNALAHSGNNSAQVELEDVVVDGLKVNDHLIQSGGVFMGWFYFENNLVPDDLNLEIGAESMPLVKVAQTGDWVLLSSKIPGSTFQSIGIDNELSIVLNKTDATLNTNVFIDDVRFQPFDAEGNCYVYETTSLRLLTEFDDQHFGIYYQYNDEGQLVSRSIETERGLKTVTETQYNLPKEQRSDSE